MNGRVAPDLLLDFPCNYEFKAFGLAEDAFREAVKTAVGRIVPVSDDALKVRLSSGGRYQSVSIYVQLHNSSQLKQIYDCLRGVEGLKYLL